METVTKTYSYSAPDAPIVDDVVLMPGRNASNVQLSLRVTNHATDGSVDRVAFWVRRAKKDVDWTYYGSTPAADSSSPHPGYAFTFNGLEKSRAYELGISAEGHFGQQSPVTPLATHFVGHPADGFMFDVAEAWLVANPSGVFTMEEPNSGPSFDRNIVRVKFRLEKRAAVVVINREWPIVTTVLQALRMIDAVPFYGYGPHEPIVETAIAIGYADDAE